MLVIDYLYCCFLLLVGCAFIERDINRCIIIIIIITAYIITAVNFINFFGAQGFRIPKSSHTVLLQVHFFPNATLNFTFIFPCTW